MNLQPLRARNGFWSHPRESRYHQCSLFVGTESRSLTLKTTVSKKMNRRNRSQEKNKRSRSKKAGKQKSRKNSPLPRNQRTHLRNESEFSPKKRLGENSDKGVSGQYLRPNIHPIYQVALIESLNPDWRDLSEEWQGA